MTRGRIRVSVALIAGLLGVPAPGVVAQVGPPFGPFRIAELSPVYRVFHTPTAQPADLLDRGVFRVDLGTTYLNLLERGVSDSEADSVYFDFERLLNTVTVRYGIGDRIEIGGQLGSRVDWGGFLDSFIRGWHELFGLKNGDRDKVGDDRFGGSLASDSVELLRLSHGFHLEDLRLLAGWRALGGRGERGALSVRASARLPTGDQGNVDGRIGAAVELNGRWSWTRSHLHSALGVVTLRAPPELSSVARSSALTFVMGFERAFSDRWSLLAQLQGGTPYLEGVGVREADRPPMNLAIGAAGVVGDGWMWQATFVEDAVSNGPSVDLALDLQIARQWGGG